MQATFLDFDGVIIDSIYECFIISRDTYYGSRSFGDEDRIKELFWKYRGLVGPAYQYLVLFKAIDNCIGLLEFDLEREFCYLDQNIDLKTKNEFEESFFSTRKFYQKDLKQWLSLNPLTEYGKTLCERPNTDCFIITTKDKDSVRLLLKHHRIKMIEIFDKTDYHTCHSKGNIITDFLNNHPEYTDAIFVDDYEKHLDSANDKRITCYFADWGYGQNSHKYENFTF